MPDYYVVCNLSEVADQKISFLWEIQTGVAFDSYHLTGTSRTAFNKAVADTRECLGKVVHYLHGRRSRDALAACYQLAIAGNRLYRAIFDAGDDAGKKEAKLARKWLESHRDKDVASLEVIVNSLRPIPWTVVYDEVPKEDRFLNSSPIPFGRVTSAGTEAPHWKPFWGLRFNLASRRRTRPTGVAPLLNPRVLLVMDYQTYSDLSKSGDPAAEPHRLIEVARVQNATVCLVLSREEFDQLPPNNRARLIQVLGKDWEALLQAATDASQRTALEESLAKIIRIIHPDQLEEVLEESKPSVMYVICHAERTSLILGRKEFDTTRLYSLCRDYIGDGLAFLNACGTGANTTKEAGSFFDSVYDASMRGLVATEEQTVDLFAHHFGLDFLQEFLQHEVGVAWLLRKLRRDRVPLGLLYSAYCPANLYVSRQPAAAAECQ
jgi:hypothetical protein